MKMAIDWRGAPKRYLAVGVASLALLMGAAGAASADPHDAHPDDRPGQERADRGDGPNHERYEHKKGYERNEHANGHDEDDREVEVERGEYEFEWDD